MHAASALTIHHLTIIGEWAFFKLIGVAPCGSCLALFSQIGRKTTKDSQV
jgi:hypothetical protein